MDNHVECELNMKIRRFWVGRLEFANVDPVQELLPNKQRGRHRALPLFIQLFVMSYKVKPQGRYDLEQ